MKKIIIAAVLFILFFSMLLLSDITKSGALTGLNLWLFTLVPTLLPFMLISSVITETGSYSLLSHALGPVMSFLFKLPKEAGYPFFIGLFCGFPMGSKTASDMVRAGKLSVLHGNILLTFCNNISPPFIISYLVAYILRLSGKDAVIVCVILFISPIVTGILFSRLLPILDKRISSRSSYPVSTGAKLQKHERGLMDTCILKSFENITKLGGYIILFTIFCSIFTLFMENTFLCCAVSGLLEITSGLSSFYSLPSSDAVTLSACMLTSFGGICAIAQTYSMIHGSGLSLPLYITGKLTNSLVTMTMLLFFFA